MNQCERLHPFQLTHTLHTLYVHCTHYAMHEQLTGETYLVHTELDPDWVANQAVSKLRGLLYRYGDHWSCNYWMVFRPHSTNRVWKQVRMWK